MITNINNSNANKNNNSKKHNIKFENDNTNNKLNKTITPRCGQMAYRVGVTTDRL